MVEALGHPLAAAMPKVIGDATLAWYDELGIHVMLNTVVDSVERGAVHLVGGQRLESDATVIGVGVRPATAWVGEAVDRTQRGAVIVDAHCRTNRPDIFAVGDCTAFPSQRYGIEQLHVEHWDNARKQPMVAAANLLGIDEQYDPVPYFWSNQLGRMIQYVGHHIADAELIWRGDPSEPKWSAVWVEGERLLAAVGVGKPRDVIQSRMLMEAGTPSTERLSRIPRPASAQQQPLARELAGLWSARRGTYRVIYSIDEEEMIVSVTRIANRASAYRR